jgi:SAM-dependent methyltransferase/uncharacterized protein YbaR (Trm112 family)
MQFRILLKAIANWVGPTETTTAAFATTEDFEAMGSSLSPPGSAALAQAFACPDCGKPLSAPNENLECIGCRKSWPVRDGIPRFFEPSYYRGELSQQEARDFVQEARQTGWHAAAMRRFAGDGDMQAYLTDWQRAAWLPLLGLGDDSVALDVGSGYGAITHSLARGTGRVFSLEAIPERIEFTRIRLDQEGLNNVQLVQSSFLNLPFREQMFDLIVVNGAIERVAEWTDQGSPRDVQIRFLEALRSKLKPTGVLVIGVENRFAYAGPRGAIGHSGAAYTSLMPRAVASWYLRRVKRQDYRTQANTGREYRIHSYGAGGWRKLLADSGFGSRGLYLCDPGYNRPYSLIPLRRQLVADHLDTKISEPSLPARHEWRFTAKQLAPRCGLMQLVSPEFAILARKDAAAAAETLWLALRRSLPELPQLRAPVFALSSNAYKLTNLVRVYEDKDLEIRCILKTTTPGPDGSAQIEREDRALGVACEQVARIPDPCFSVPRPFGVARVGRFTYLAESVAPGQSLSRVALGGLLRRRKQVLEREIPRSLRAAIQIAKGFSDASPVAKLNAGWWELPEGIEFPPVVAREIADLKRRWESGEDSRVWVQHGDFTLENVCVEPASGKLTILDWENLVQGGPPLYDLFTMLTNVALGEDLPPGAPPCGGDTARVHFETIFFGRSRWTDHFREWTTVACEALSIPPTRAWPMFLQTLLFRHHDLKGRGSFYLANEYAGFLRAAGAKADKFFLLR